MKKSFLVVFSFLIFISVSLAADTPMGTVKEYVNRVISTLRDSALTPEKKRAIVEKIIDEAIYWGEVSRLVLGIHWKRLSNKQREEFGELFRRFVEKVYSRKFVKYSLGEDLSKIKVEYKREIQDGDRATVITSITTAKGSVVPVSFKLLKVRNGWLIYDIYVEGISMVNNYRTQINRVILRKGFEHLIEVLRRKVKS